MSLFTTLLSPLAIIVSCLTATSLFVHDMQIDKAAKSSLALPAAVATYKAIEGGAQFSEAGHVHVESSLLSSAFQSGTPRMLPRDDSRKYVLSKRVVRGVHAFDGYYMPMDL